jgi:NAD(P)-dependent dehydrogenase (short-subunit alcohol dehydrogenase family)
MPEDELTFDDSHLNEWSDEERFEVTRERIAEYAAATNDPIPAHRSGDIAPPVFAIVPVFQPLPGMAVYSGTKAFVQTFSEAVHEELYGTGVSCTVLCPGPVPTEWADIADAHQWRVGIAQVSSADVAQAAIDGMLEGKRSVLPGLVPKIVGIGGRFAAPQFPSAGAAPRPGVARSIQQIGSPGAELADRVAAWQSATPRKSSSRRVSKRFST